MANAEEQPTQELQGDSIGSAGATGELQLDKTAPSSLEATAPLEAPTSDAVADVPSFEVDVDLSSDVLATQTPTKKKGANKTPSILGTNLANKPGSGNQPCSPTSGKKSKAIAYRYSYEVREADRARKIGYLPMEKQAELKPVDRDVARDMCSELQVRTQAAGGTYQVSKGPGWDAIMGNDKFQKRLQFLQEHARTGTHVEQYGMDGQYEGDFMHGMRHGRGRYEFRGEIYNGEWKWDQRHGEGELKCTDGSTIKGSFQNGKPHGMATVVDKNGAQIYEGEFKDGKRDGLGRQNFDSGDMYTGGWKNGRLHDRGVYYFSNGDRLNGMWKEGVYDGVGIFFYADGSKSRREYRDGLLISVQDCEGETQRYGKTLKKVDMQKHTRDREFPQDVFLLSAV